MYKDLFSGHVYYKIYFMGILRINLLILLFYAPRGGESNPKEIEIILLQYVGEVSMLGYTSMEGFLHKVSIPDFFSRFFILGSESALLIFLYYYF